MRVIIAGSRGIKDPAFVDRAMEAWVEEHGLPTRVVCGGADGVDNLGRLWANKRNIPVDIYFAQWATYGVRAGAIRNGTMGDNADALVALWDGHSRGTADMIRKAENRGLVMMVFVVLEDGEMVSSNNTQGDEGLGVL